MKYLRNIHPKILFSHLNHLQEKVESGKISRDKVIIMLGVLSPTKKECHQTYLSQDYELFIVASYDIWQNTG